MRRILFAVAALVLFFGCQKEEYTTEKAGSGTDLFCSVEMFDGTRTSMDNNGNVLWSSGDQIVAFCGNTQALKYQVQESYVGKSSGKFSKVEESGAAVSVQDIDHNILVYPYSTDVEWGKADGSSPSSSYDIGIVLPQEQKYEKNSFANGAFPMVAVSSTGHFSFKNVCGGIKLQLMGSGKVKSIKLTGGNNELLSGEATVTVYANGSDPRINMAANSLKTVVLDCGTGVQLSEKTPTEFIIALPPVEFAKGFTITVTNTNGIEYTKSAKTSNKVERSSLLVMPEIECEFIREEIFDESKCLIYKVNGTGGWDATNENYRSTNSYIKMTPSGSVLEMKFQLQAVGQYDRAFILSSGNQNSDNSSKLFFTATYMGIENSQIYRTWKWEELGVSPTDLINLRLSTKDYTITINGKTLSCEGLKLSWTYIFSGYFREYDEGEYQKYYSVPEDSKLFYVRMYDAAGNLTYLGHPSKAINPQIFITEYCWYSIDNNGTISYQFAHDAANQGGYGGNF